jgi:hypothetical protein
MRLRPSSEAHRDGRGEVGPPNSRGERLEPVRPELFDVVPDRPLRARDRLPIIAELGVLHANGERDRLYTSQAGLVEGGDELARPGQRARELPASCPVSLGIERRRGVPENPLIDQAAGKIPHCGGDDAARARHTAHAVEGLAGVRHEVESQKRKAAVETVGR